MARTSHIVGRITAAALALALVAVPLGAVSRPAAARAATANPTPEVIDPNASQDPDQAAADADRVERLLNSVPASRRDELTALMAELDELDRQTEMAAEEYNSARDRLSAVNTNIAQAQVDYEAITKAYNEQSAKVSERLVAIYREGVPLEIALLLSADNLADLLGVMDYVFDPDAGETTLLVRLKQEKVHLEDTISSLTRDRAAAESLQFEMKARQIEVGYRVAEREALLKKRSPSLVALLRATENAADQDEQDLYYKITGGGLADVTIETGSPVETALAYRGIPYVWGGATKLGMDCSGLLVYVFAQHGVKLPHHAAAQATLGTAVTGELQPGDAVFFGSPVHHVGIYIGGGYYIHAPHTGDVVRIAKLSGRSDLVGARRYDWRVRSAAIK